LGALIGCFLVITVSRRFGTKRAMLLLNGCILLTGSIIMALPAIIDLVPLLVVGRTITGVYTGLAITMVPLFLHEVAPKEIKVWGRSYRLTSCLIFRVL
jgi:MFS family permease